MEIRWREEYSRGSKKMNDQKLARIKREQGEMVRYALAIRAMMAEQGRNPI